MYLLQSPTVTGEVVVLQDIYSPQLDNTRDIFVYVPPSYHEGERRYPVIYMHDGQNLFDESESFSGEWQVDEAMEELSRQGMEAIVVGISNMGAERLEECSPFHCPDITEPRAEHYLAFLVETVKPLIDSTFRTLPDPARTGMIGSSMGGLVTLYAFYRHPHVFGFAGVMSPSCWFADRAIFPVIESQPYFPGRKLYVDVGTHEGENELMDGRRLRDLLLSKGYQVGTDFLYVEDQGAGHTESAWAYRLQIALRFLLPRSEATTVPTDLAA